MGKRTFQAKATSHAGKHKVKTKRDSLTVVQQILDKGPLCVQHSLSSEITAIMEESSLHASVGCDSSGRYEGLRKEADHNGGERESHQGRVNSLQKCPEEK